MAHSAHSARGVTSHSTIWMHSATRRAATDSAVVGAFGGREASDSTALGAKTHPKSSRKRARDALGTPRGTQERSEGVLDASWDVPGASRERPESPQRRPRTPKRAPGEIWERAEANKIDAKSRPGAKKSSLFHAARSRSAVGAIFRRFRSIFGFSAESANPRKYCACQQKQRFGTSHRESSHSRDATSKNDENRSRI